MPTSTFNPDKMRNGPFGPSAGTPLDPFFDFMGSLFSPPQGQNYNDAAHAQYASSQHVTDQQTQQNRPDQQNAYGSGVQWTIGPDGRPRMIQNFGGQLGGAMNALQGQFAASAGDPFMGGDAAREQAINASFGQARSRLDPMFAQNEESLEAKLANQGLSPGTEAYDNARAQFGRDKNDAYSSAMNSAIGMGNEAADQVFRQNMAARNAPLEQMLAMGGMLNMPGFNAAGRADPFMALQAAGLQGASDLERWQAQQQNLGGMFEGMANLGTKFIKP